jgi:hypothetical protein
VLLAAIHAGESNPEKQKQKQKQLPAHITNCMPMPLTVPNATARRPKNLETRSRLHPISAAHAPRRGPDLRFTRPAPGGMPWLASTRELDNHKYPAREVRRCRQRLMPLTLTSTRRKVVWTGRSAFRTYLRYCSRYVQYIRRPRNGISASPSAKGTRGAGAAGHKRPRLRLES